MRMALQACVAPPGQDHSRCGHGAGQEVHVLHWGRDEYSIVAPRSITRSVATPVVARMTVYAAANMAGLAAPARANALPWDPIETAAAAATRLTGEICGHRSVRKAWPCLRNRRQSGHSPCPCGAGGGGAVRRRLARLAPAAQRLPAAGARTHAVRVGSPWSSPVVGTRGEVVWRRPIPPLAHLIAQDD